MSMESAWVELPGLDESSGDRRGVVVVETTSNQPLPLSVYLFESPDEADEFMEWVEYRDKKHWENWPELVPLWRSILKERGL